MEIQENMDMISDPIDLEKLALLVFDDLGDILIKPFSSINEDSVLSILCTENYMKIITGATHVTKIMEKNRDRERRGDLSRLRRDW